MVEVPRPPPTGERQAEYDRANRIGQALFGGHVGKDHSTPLKFPKHMTVWWDKESPFKRRGKFFTVWREPNGRFAKRPAPGERARRLGLTK